MSLGKGMGAVKRVQREAKQSQKAAMGWKVRDLYLKGGEEAAVYLTGVRDNEPLIVKQHIINLGGNKYRDDWCQSKGCVYCYFERKGDKRIGKPRKVGVFNAFDARWVHTKKREGGEKRRDGEDFLDYFECTGGDEGDPDECKKCKRGVDRKRNGSRKLVLPMTWLEALIAHSVSLQKKCVCGGKTSFLHFKNSEGKKVLDLEDVDDDEMDDFKAVYKCKSCDDPRPVDIFTGGFVMRRAGTGKSTSYTFSKIDSDVEPPEELDEVEPLDLEEALVPRSQEKQAELLGKDNPFDEDGGKGKGSSRFDDEDLDEEDEDDDEKPKSKKSKKQKKQKDMFDDEDEDD